MIYVPLFSWGELLKVIFIPKRLALDRVSDCWARDSEKAFLLSRTMWSLECIAKLRKSINSTKNINIWVPDFFCNSSLALIRQADVKLIFYPINDDLSPNLEALEEIAKNNDLLPDLVIVTHYFGGASNVKGIAKLSKRFGAWLIEDAAHILIPIPGVGQNGDFVCYSPHKLLPMPDGAVLVMRSKGISKLQIDGSEFDLLSEIISGLPNNSLERLAHVFLWVIKRSAQKVGFTFTRTIPDFYKDEKVSLGIQYVHMSVFSKKMLALFINNLNKVADCRRQTMKRFDLLFSLSSLRCKFTKAMPREVLIAPYLVPYQIFGSGGANSLFNSLKKMRLPVSSWPDLPPEVMEAPKEHCIAISKRKEYFYIASHQSIAHSELKSLSKKIVTLKSSGWSMIELNEEQWSRYYALSINPSLLQTWEFGNAKEDAGRIIRARRFLVQTNAGEAMAIAQIMTFNIPLLGTFAYLNQGPIFLESTDPFRSDRNLLFSAKTINTIFTQSNKFGFRLLQIAPALRASQIEGLFFELLGLKKIFMRKPWASAIINLDKTSTELMSALKRSWRGHLRKSQQLGIDIQSHNVTPKTIDFLINQYKLLQQNKKFTGINEKLIRSLALQSKEQSQWRFNLFTAHEPNKLNLEDSIGLVVTIEFHDTAIYLIGLTSEVGRTTQANYALLWFAILHAKENKIKYFDLGGVSQDTPNGISDFKYGTGAAPFSLIGEWRPALFGL